MPQPWAPSTTRVDRQIDERRDDHAARRGEDRQHRVAPDRQLADQQLPLDLEPDHEEEERHQQVVDPVHERLGELPAPDEDPCLGVPERIVERVKRRVGDGERNDGRYQKRRGAGDLGVQELREPVAKADRQRAHGVQNVGR